MINFNSSWDFWNSEASFSTISGIQEGFAAFPSNSTGPSVSVLKKWKVKGNLKHYKLRKSFLPVKSRSKSKWITDCWDSSHVRILGPTET